MLLRCGHELDADNVFRCVFNVAGGGGGVYYGTPACVCAETASELFKLFYCCLVDLVDLAVSRSLQVRSLSLTANSSNEYTPQGESW